MSYKEDSKNTLGEELDYFQLGGVVQLCEKQYIFYTKCPDDLDQIYLDSDVIVPNDSNFLGNFVKEQMRKYGANLSGHAKKKTFLDYELVVYEGISFEKQRSWIPK